MDNYNDSEYIVDMETKNSIDWGPYGEKYIPE